MTRADIAAQCLACMLSGDSNSDLKWTADDFLKLLPARAVQYADALLAELAKPHAPGVVTAEEMEDAFDNYTHRGGHEANDRVRALIARMKEAGHVPTR